MDDHTIREIRRIRVNPRFRRYPEYKESGVEWVGEIPKHWEVRRNKRVFNERDNRSVTGKEELLTVSHITGVSPRAEKRNVGMFLAQTLEGYKHCSVGNLVVNTMWAWMGALGVSAFDGIVSPSYNVYELKSGEYLPRYYDYLYRTPNHVNEIIRWSKGIWTSRWRLYPDAFFSMFTIIPPFREQAQIANFLDRKTGQIDELIRIKERRIELLQEQRTALINQVVTKGLDPNVEMKPSRMEWIGEIPMHWEVKKIKHVATFVSEKSMPETDAIKISPENVESETGKVLDFFSSYDSMGVKFQVGDVLFNKIRVYLNKVVYAEYDGYSLGEMIVMRPSLQGMGKYLFYLMLSSRFIEYCNSISYGAKMPRTAVDDILNAQIPIPTDSEQRKIADFLNNKTQQVDKLVSAEQRKIELLKEYRQSLISEAVTGKIDVRNEV
ncbi:MAG: restriction endonuclease subunit S [Candidatus Poribacteria bacterium]|nr:restriction endonuclease subunit S [Candidatus Poribacteria bacterium]